MTKQSKYFFTIGIPAYNAQETIKETIYSAINQNTSYPYEVIIVDDGSTDSTGDICSAFLDYNSNITYLKTANQGPFLARRKIFEIAKGEFIVFLDADDLLKDTTIQQCGDVIKVHNPDILIFNYSYNKDFSKPRKNSSLNSSLYKEDDLKLVRTAICKGESNQLCAKAIRRKLYNNDELPNYEYSDLRHGEDLFQLLPLIDKASSVARLNDCLYYYRQNNLSETFHYSKRQIQNIDFIKSRLFLYGKKWNLEQEAAQGLLFQYCYLIKILYRDRSISKHQQNIEFQAIKKRITRIIGLDKSLFQNLSLSWKIFVKLVIENQQKLVRCLIYLSK